MNESERIRNLERELGELRRENVRLTRLLKLTEGEVQPSKGSQVAWFDQDPGSVTIESSPDGQLAGPATVVNSDGSWRYRDPAPSTGRFPGRRTCR